MAVPSDPFEKVYVCAVDRRFYERFWYSPVEEDIQSVLDEWYESIPKGAKKEAYPPMELAFQGWKGLMAYYNLTWLVDKMEKNGEELTSQNVITMCKIFGVPSPVWKLMLFLRRDPDLQKEIRDPWW
jgi:hypothetical protein